VDGVWITVENKRNSGENRLGISQGKVKGLEVLLLYPQLSPQQYFSKKTKKPLSMWEEICNYKKVILLTHILTTVITTNFKYKTFSWRVRPEMYARGVEI